MVFGKGLLCAALVAGFSVPAMAQMKIESGDIAEGAQMNRAQVRAECRIRGKERGTNTSPALAWSGAPEGTKSYAVTMLDPMDDTHYFWHWIAFNIPASVTALPPGASGTEMPQGAVEGVNDYGTTGYGGPCPPRGTTQLSLSDDVTGAQIRPQLQLHSLGKATLTARYEN
jgi:Raf kinase inhibitor-like YbhB/YbcL family protein